MGGALIPSVLRAPSPGIGVRSHLSLKLGGCSPAPEVWGLSARNWP